MENGAPTPIKMATDQAVVVFYYDLAIHLLSGMQNQLRLFKQDSPANQFQRVMELLAEKRNGFLKETQNRIQIVQAAQAPLRSN